MIVLGQVSMLLLVATRPHMSKLCVAITPLFFHNQPRLTFDRMAVEIGDWPEKNSSNE